MDAYAKNNSFIQFSEHPQDIFSKPPRCHRTRIIFYHDKAATLRCPPPIKESKKIISFPCDQHLSKKQINYIVKTVKNFYRLNK